MASRRQRVLQLRRLVHVCGSAGYVGFMAASALYFAGWQRDKAAMVALCSIACWAVALCLHWSREA